jgi:hypothetical protein
MKLWAFSNALNETMPIFSVYPREKNCLYSPTKNNYLGELENKIENIKIGKQELRWLFWNQFKPKTIR